MRLRGPMVAAVAVSTAMAIGSCTQTVEGTATRITDAPAAAARSYGYADDRCGLLADETVREKLAAKELNRTYNGAICQYVVFRGPRGTAVVDLTFAWFSSGTLAREREVAQQRDAQVSDTVLVRHDAFLARSAAPRSACAATAATEPGIVSWWVQLRDGEEDACRDAETLLTATLSADM